jgi:hypothetical protein
MSSTAAATNKSEDPANSAEPSKEDETVPHLGVLEEDDEFEEFPVQGELLYVPCTSLLSQPPFGAQIGTTPKSIWRILEALLLERPSRKEISFGRTIGMMMTLRRTSAYS